MTYEMQNKNFLDQRHIDLIAESTAIYHANAVANFMPDNIVGTSLP